jgi:putative PIG3 family NAD(P)H quinone oxidoreductase
VRVIEITAHGGPDVLRPAERDDPAPGPGEVLIEVAAAGVNRPDLMQREGKYPPPKGASDIPGLEVAGRIAALGPADAAGAPASANGRAWRVGDRVCALISGGGYAERCVAPGVQCLSMPGDLSSVEAAALPETYFTVWTNIFDRGRLSAGEWLLVHGGTSGIGSTAIQLAVARGSHVIATAGSDEKCRACERLGAAHAINYRSHRFVEAVKSLTEGRGVDVVLDIIGAPYTVDNLDSLAQDGRLVQIGVMGGVNAQISLRTMLTKRLTITASTLRARTPSEKGAIAAALEREVWPLVASRRVGPVIDRTFPLDQAADAHRVLESGEVVGKVVLTIASGGADLQVGARRAGKIRPHQPPPPARPAAGCGTPVYLGGARITPARQASRLVTQPPDRRARVDPIRAHDPPAERRIDVRGCQAPADLERQQQRRADERRARKQAARHRAANHQPCRRDSDGADDGAPRDQGQRHGPAVRQTGQQPREPKAVVESLGADRARDDPWDEPCDEPSRHERYNFSSNSQQRTFL